MEAFAGWPGWPVSTFIVVLVVLFKVWKCCGKGPKVIEPGSNGHPMPIFGYVFDNGPTRHLTGCAYDKGVDAAIVGAKVVLMDLSRKQVKPPYSTSGSGYYGFDGLVAGTTYLVEVTDSAGQVLQLCSGMANPRTVHYAGGDHRVDFPKD